MKKVVSIIGIFLAVFVTCFSVKVFAAALENIDIAVSKSTVHPNEEVTVNVAFGTDLGAYTVDVAYDNNLFEYVSANGGTADDNGTRVRVYFYDTTGGTNPRNSMSVTFKAKSEIITSNPTDFSITAEGMANPDASVTYDDITTPIIKNVIVEPIYEDYEFAFDYTGDVIANEEKDIKITVSSALGKSYEHTRIIASTVEPNDGTVKLLATDAQTLEHDIIQNGWGSASGDPIGGKNVSKELSIKGIFSVAGEYTITLKLIDRDNSDVVIASDDFTVAVKEKSTAQPDNNNNNTNTNTNINTNTNTNTNNNPGINNNTNTGTSAGSGKVEPEKLPQTGNTIYVVIILSIAVLVISYVVLKPKE